MAAVVCWADFPDRDEGVVGGAVMALASPFLPLPGSGAFFGAAGVLEAFRVRVRDTGMVSLRRKLAASFSCRARVRLVRTGEMRGGLRRHGS